jgi:hypothetical protein
MKSGDLIRIGLQLGVVAIGGLCVWRGLAGSASGSWMRASLWGAAAIFFWFLAWAFGKAVTS